MKQETPYPGTGPPGACPETQICVRVMPRSLTWLRPAAAVQLAATRAVANSRANVNALLPALLTAVGVDSSSNAAKLAELMRDLRSSFMGLAGGYQAKDGVWKIGQGHIDDLKSGEVKVDMSKANFVTREDFNKEFDAWNDLRLAGLKTKK